MLKSKAKLKIVQVITSHDKKPNYLIAAMQPNKMSNISFPCYNLLILIFRK